MKTLQHFNISTRNLITYLFFMFAYSTIAYGQNPNSNPNAQGQWKLTGNNNADTNKFVGTINNVDLVFKRNNIESFRLLEDTAAKFSGDVFLDKFKEKPPINSGPPKEVFLKVDNQGKIISTDKSGLLESIYTSPNTCLSSGLNVNLPIWSALSNPNYGVLYTGIDCPARVGIGTNNPVSTLQVVGNGFFQGNLGVNVAPTTINTLSIVNPVNRTGILLQNDHPTSIILKYGIKNIVNNPNTIAYSVTDQTTNQDVFVVMGDGKTGIGTATPSTTLEVNGNGLFTESLQVRTNQTKFMIGSAAGEDLGWGTSYIGFNAVRTANNTWETSSDFANNGGSVIYGDIFGSILFATIPTLASSGGGGTGQSNITDLDIKNSVNLFIHRDGNVGIGIFAVNGAKLSVEGIIRARRVLVNATPWADYVFEPTYQLMTLTQLEEYITTNKHLPNMPTAEEVEKEGADLGEINRVLVEKVEELTLYIIALNKRMEQLEADNTLLKNKMDFK
ncbi:MAG: hypothetical protein RQ875_06140 [Vicingaceae bacterium]|nr:hypothetical protein [Vicingaceae bacterium]